MITLSLIVLFISIFIFIINLFATGSFETAYLATEQFILVVVELIKSLIEKF